MSLKQKHIAAIPYAGSVREPLNNIFYIYNIKPLFIIEPHP